MPLSKLILAPLCFFMAAPFLQGCLFETKSPRTLPLKLDSTFFQYNPLVITFLDDSGRVTDTLYRGPGDAVGSLTPLITIEGLADRGQVRIEGYIEAKLAYRLLLAYPVDTLIATPRWVPLGQPLLDYEPRFHSMVIHQGKPFVSVAERPFAPYLLGFDSVAWNRDGERIPKAPGYYAREQIFSDSDQLVSFLMDRNLMMNLYSASKWVPTLADEKLWGQSYSFRKGVVAAAVTPSLLDTTYIRIYREDSGWKAVETKAFPGYLLSNFWDSFTPGAIAQGEGIISIFLKRMTSGYLVQEYRLFQRRNGKWDSTSPPKGFVMSEPTMALEKGLPYVAFEDLTTNADSSRWFGHVSLIKHGPGGWEPVGNRDIFGKEARRPNLSFHGGMPYVGAICEGRGYRVARFKDSRWETLVEYPLSGGPNFRFDLALDGLGALYLAVSSDLGLKVLKFTDPRLP